MEREYIVTCKTREDLESLYDDLETPGGSLHIPDRAVECLNKRPISRNTHYSLTDEEAALVKQDDRVLDVELTPEALGITFHPNVTIEGSETIEETDGEDISNDPAYTQTSNRWSKTNNVNDTFRNWGLLRSINGDTFNNWGYDGNSNVSTTSVRVTSTGKNVDVVIVDGRFDPDHPEFAVNEDGSGGSRVVQYNWLQDTPSVTGGAAGTYEYEPYINVNSNSETANNNHGCHCAGTAAGNRRGWAREANIYNIDLYSTDPNNLGTTLVFDYIRYWHNNKPINTETGKRNPTVCNNSWGSSFGGSTISNITSIVYRGTTYNGPFTAAECTAFGILNDGTSTNSIPALTTAFAADMQDAMDDGVIMVAAAGNNSFLCDREGGINYNNRFVAGSTYYYHRGSQPAAIPGVISVGNASARVDEAKRNDSSVGPRVDLYAAGDRIISSVHNGTLSNGSTITNTTDSRNSSYRIAKYGGTSMASPQVCGSIACMLEHWPRISHNEIVRYLEKYGTTEDQMNDTGRTARNYTVNNSGNNYTFSGDATGTNPDITVQEGNILTFSINVSSNHPFYIVTTLGGNNTTNEVSQGFLTVPSSRTSGDMRWDTRGVTPGTYYYVCDVHGSMNGEIVIESDHDDNQSLQDDSFTDITLNVDNGNRYLYHINSRRVPNEPGSTYYGGSTVSEIQQPRGEYKFRDYDSSGGEDVILYPRRDTWSR